MWAYMRLNTLEIDQYKTFFFKGTSNKNEDIKIKDFLFSLTLIWLELDNCYSMTVARGESDLFELANYYYTDVNNRRL